MTNELLSIENFHLHLIGAHGLVYGVRGIDMKVQEGSIHGIIGESGSGKTITAKSVLRLHDEKRCVYSGKILYQGSDVLSMSNKELQAMRGKEIAMISQDPLTALNPLYTIGNQMSEVMRLHLKISAKEAKRRAIELLEQVGIVPGERRYNQYPFELSGGQLQRVCIAMAISCNPRLLIADEPTTALDVTTQAQILEMLKNLRDQMGMTILIITHNFGVVAEMCDQVSVMYNGKIVEQGSTTEIFHHAQEAYTKKLMNSMLRKDQTPLWKEVRDNAAR